MTGKSTASRGRGTGGEVGTAEWEYVLVAQDQPRIERYRRFGDAEWLLTEAKGLDGSIELTSVECRLELREVYRKVL